MNTQQAITRLQANVTQDSQTLLNIKNCIDSGNKSFDGEFLLAWGERVESCERGIEALNNDKGYVKNFCNRAYLVLDVLTDDVICVIK